MTEKKKFKLKVEKIKPEKTPDGFDVLRMRLKTEKGTYLKGVSLANWEDPEKKRSIVNHWIKDISRIESHKELSEAEIKEKVKKYEGEELTDE
jgi:hypothetical protein